MDSPASIPQRQGGITNPRSSSPSKHKAVGFPSSAEAAFSALEALADGVSVISEDRTIVFMNGRLKSDLGDLVGKKCTGSLLASHEVCRACPLDSDWPFDEKPYRDVVETDDGKTMEYVLTRLNDIASGKVYYVCVRRDITKSLATESKLKTLASCFDQMAEAVCVVDTKGRMIYINRAFSELTGFSEKSVAGMTMTEMTGVPPSTGTLESLMKDALKGNVHGELTGLKKGGTRYYAHVEAKPVRGEDREELGAVGILRDVTREMAERAEMERYKSQLEERMQERTNELARRVSQLTTINKISRDVTSMLDPDELMDEFVRSIHQGFGFAQVVLMMMDRERGEMYLKAGYGREVSNIRRDMRLKLREGIVGHCAYYVETLVSGNVQTDPRYLEQFPTSTKSELAIPVSFRGELIAVLDIQSDVPDAFTTNDVSLLEMLADMLAIAITNARVYTESKERESALSILDRISKQISSRLDSTVILDQVARDAASLLKGEKAMVGLIDEKTNSMRWVAGYNFEKDSMGSLHFAADSGVTGRAIRRMKAEVVNEYLSDPDAREEYAKVFGVKSLAVAPLTIEGRSIGVINVYNKLGGNRFTRTDAIFLSSLADHAAIALENANLLASLNHRVSSQLALLETSISLQREIDSGSTYEIVADKLGEVVWYDSLSVYMINQDTQMILPVLARGTYADEIMVESFPVGEGITGAVAQSGVAEVVDDNAQDARAVLVEGTPDERESMMVVPLKGRDLVIGVLVLYRLGGATFTAAEFEVVQLFANQSAVAVENAELYRTERELLAESTAKVEQMAKVLEMTTSVMYMDNLDKLLQRLVDAVVESFGFKRASVSLYDFERDVFVNRALAGYPAWVHPGAVMQSHRAIEDMKDENKTGTTCYLSRYETQKYGIEAFDFLAHPEFAGRPRTSPDAWHGRDILVCALKDRSGRLSGYIQFDEPVDGKLPSRSRIEALEILAGIASIAVENSKMFETQVTVANEVALLNDLMTHDINNFNQGIMGYIELLLQDRRLDDSQRKYAEKALHQVRNNARLIDNVRKLSKVRTMADADYVVMDLQKPLLEAIDVVTKAFADRKVVVNSTVLSGRHFIHGSQYAFDLFANVISNAVKFDSAKQVRVDVLISEETTPKGKYWVVSVVDRGRGIPEDRKAVVFERFASGMTGMKGFGLGLSIVSAIVENMGGRIWVEDRIKGNFSKGAVFKIMLPQATPPAKDSAGRPEHEVHPSE